MTRHKIKENKFNEIGAGRWPRIRLVAYHICQQELKKTLSPSLKKTCLIDKRIDSESVGSKIVSKYDQEIP